MRIPDNVSYKNAIKYMTDAKAKYDELSTIASTHKNFQKSSDDPSLVSSSMVLRSSVSASKGYIASSENAQEWMNNTESSFGLMNDLFVEAKSILLKASSDTVGTDERVNDYAIQITQILNQAISIANTSYNDNYLFSGTQVRLKPFTLDTNASGLFVDYDGNTNTMKRDIAPGVSITINSDGVAAFNDFFDALIFAKESLETDNLANISTALGDVDSALTVMNQSRTNNAAILRQLETGKEHLETTQLELKALLSLKEDANMAEAISMFTLQQTTYQTVLDVSSRAISALNLFDLLQ